VTTDNDLHPIEASVLHARRERVFLILSGLFLGTLAMLNILGISRFIKLAELTTDGGTTLTFAIAVGVLPYPLTFLCTDFISEFYGRRRANFVVFVGLLLNIWVVFVMWLGGVLPGFETVDPGTGEIIRDAAGRLPVFFEIRALTFGAVAASMIAYMAAQFCDVYVFHFWKRVTRGRLLWVRNNGSTMVSQLVDTTAVILITHFYAHALPVDPDQPLARQLVLFIVTGYTFKFGVAAFDTLPFYLGVRWLSRYLEIDPTVEHGQESQRSTRASPSARP
jgi:uncharacterized PurR-regulated membrane protein YhhQ (DUF165 family)